MKVQELIRYSLFFLWIFFYLRFYHKGEDWEEEGEKEGKQKIFEPLVSSFDFLGRGIAGTLSLSSPALIRKKVEWMEILKGRGQGRKEAKKEEERLLRDLFLLLPFLFLFLFTPSIFWFFLVLLGLRYFASIYLLRRRAQKEKNRVEGEVSELLTGLVLSLRAGMLLDKAWMELSKNKKGPLYEEMRRVSQMRREGFSISQAYLSFGDRYPIESLRDLSQLLVQNMELGGSELARGIDQLRKKETKDRIHRLQKAADRAQEQMLLPSLLQFIGILLLLLVPLFSQNLL